MKAILGHKVGMTQIWNDAGRLLPATVITASPNSVIDKTDNQTLIGVATSGKTAKPQQNLPQKLQSKRGIWLKSLPGSVDAQQLTVDQFSVGEKVSVTGITKGKGFAGGVKRHGFAGWPSSHGHSHQRRPGSIGAQRPQRVVKGQKMAGHMGAVQFTSRGSTILSIDSQKQIIVVSGAVPGPRKGRVFIKSQEEGR